MMEEGDTLSRVRVSPEMNIIKVSLGQWWCKFQSILTSVQSYRNGGKEFRVIACDDTLVDSSIRFLEGKGEGGGYVTIGIWSISGCGSNWGPILQPHH